jgi:hypothetical protein
VRGSSSSPSESRVVALILGGFVSGLGELWEVGKGRVSRSIWKSNVEFEGMPFW